MDLLHQTTTPTSNKASWMTWADWTGLAASIACGIHCAAMPLLLSYLPSFGLSWLAHEGFHQWMTVLCFVFAASAFIPGWRKHKSLVPAFSGVIGITLLSLSAFVFGDECCAAATGSPLAQNATCTDAACTDAAGSARLEVYFWLLDILPITAKTVRAVVATVASSLITHYGN